MKNRFVLFTMIFLLAAVGGLSCGEEGTAKVSVELYGWLDDGSEEGRFSKSMPDFVGAQNVRIRITEPDTGTVVEEQTVSLDDRGMVLPELEGGQGMRMEFAVLGSSGPIASGATPVFDFDGNDAAYVGFRAMVSEINAFAPVGSLIRFSGSNEDTLVQSTFDTRRLDYEWSGRIGHTAHLADSGEVLVVGGARVSSTYQPAHFPSLSEVFGDIQLFDESSGYFTELGGDSAAVSADVIGQDRLETPRAFHTVTPLGNERFLVVGGFRLIGETPRPTSSIDIIDLNASAGSRVQPLMGAGGSEVTLAEARGLHTATFRKSDGKVIVAGGMGNDNDTIRDTIEIIDPDSGSIESGIAMSSARVGHSSVLLEDDESVWLIGGRNTDNALDSTEVVQASASQAGPTMERARYGASAMHMGSKGNDLVIVLGGFTGLNNGATREYEFGNPLSGDSFHSGSNYRISQARGNAHLFTLPQSGEMVVMGGYDPDHEVLASVERLSIELNTSPPLSFDTEIGSMFQERGEFAASPVSNGRILLVGGDTPGETQRNDAEYFNPYDPVRPRR